MKLLRLSLVALLMTCLFWTFSTAQEAKDKDAKEKDAKEDKGPFKNLKFRSIGPAAGGRVSRACGVPGDPSTYYAAAAASGVWKSTDGGFSWKSIFDDQPTSSIGAIAVAPSDPNIIYVGSGEANIRGNVMPGNGIYKSTTGGKSWKHVWKQKGQIGQMIVHPTNPDIALAAVLGSIFYPRERYGPDQENDPARGVYRTTDGGKTWTRVLSEKRFRGKVHTGTKGEGLGPLWKSIGAIDVCFDPANPRVLFAALWETERSPWEMTSGGSGSGIYRSDNAGDTWKRLGPNGEKEAKDDSSRMRAALSEAGLGPKGPRESADDDNGLPEGIWGRVGLAIAPSDSRRIYALVEAEKGGLYRSDDGGEKWSLINAGRYLRQRPWYFSTLTVDPANPDVVWCQSVRQLKSIDGGKTFKGHKGMHHGDNHDLWIDAKNPRRMIGSNDGGVNISVNGGETWYAPPLPISQFYHISVDNAVPYNIMGNMQDLGTARGPSNSLSSTGIVTHDWHPVGGGETGSTVADPRDPNIIYSGEYGGFLSRYDHRNRQARNITTYPFNPSGHGAEDLKYRFQWTAPLLISPNDPKKIYHAANVLFASTDEGNSWKAISPDLTRNDKSKQKWSGGPITGDNTGVEIYGTIFAVAESPKKAGMLWAGSDDGLVHVSQDGGQKWDNVTKNIPGLPEWATVTCIEASPSDPAVAYLVADAHRLDDNKPYLWKTADYGKTWINLSAKLPQEDYLRVVRVDPVGQAASLPKTAGDGSAGNRQAGSLSHGLLFVGSETGIHFSRDDGQTWEKLKLNLPTAAICDMHVKDNDLVVGTNGRSIWILDDITPIRQWKAETKAPHLFPVQPSIRWRYHGELYTPEDRHPGANPPKGAVIHYFLDKKPKDEIALEIFDKDNNRVRELTSKKSDVEDDETAPDPTGAPKPTVLAKEPGLHRVAWDLSQTGPKIIPGARNDAGIPFRGPLALPGVYTLKLTVDGKTLTEKLQVLPDPRCKSSMEELIARHDFAMKVDKNISSLSNAVIDLKSLRAQLKDRKEAWKNLDKAKELLAPIDKLLARLDDLESKLHNPKAEVTYDILAMKGGAKLYSQLAPIYATAIEADVPLTQGMREVYADVARELGTLLGEWRSCREDLNRINERARALEIPNVVVPESK
ncbi:MAG: glycosyl hydrolase [Planctomycetes bacterium]|nr:glycosyl hydrolase [Planctomycetota bacterium]